VTQRVLQGPFLTRAEAARRAKVPAQLLVHRPDLLKVGGRWLPEVYFAFQFDEHGVLPGLGSVVQSLKGKYTDIGIGDWLVRPNLSLGHSTPLRFLNGGGSVEQVISAATSEGPIAATVDRPQPEPVPGSRETPDVSAPARRRVRRSGARQPVFHGR